MCHTCIWKNLSPIPLPGPAQTMNSYIVVYYTGLLVGRGKKSQISRDFQGQIRGKNGRFRRTFAGIFEANFAEKRLVNNGRFRGRSPEQILLESNWFCADLRKVFNETRRSYRFTQASYRNMKAYFTSKLIEHNKNQ